ncbi:tyrosine-type recombinase/integrase [Amphritea sp. HPY]|uniref:tyrosine-type recombinase/integrase n=1 Tax=Amphritea sp. HPY TaxID=3421652 RepID=UPI003D7D7487
MGSIRARGNGGNLFFDFRYQGKRCREQTLLPDTPGNRKKLQEVMDRIEAEITLGNFNYALHFPNSKNGDLTVGALASLKAQQQIGPLFKEFAEEWYEENKVQWKRSYQKIVRGTLDSKLIPHFGEMSVGKIAKSDILKFRASLAKVGREIPGKELSHDRINHILTPLRMILNEASERFEFNTPCLGIKPLKIARQDIEPFSLEEVRQILNHVRSDYCNYYVVRFFTGLRTGEVDGLQWQYVDFENRRILVRETVVQGEIDSTKTPESCREVEMSEPVYAALMEQKQVSYRKSKFVFCNGHGGPLEHRNVTQRVWYPLLKHLGIKKRRPYQTRHTAATLWLASGENPEWIARQMGHSTTQMLFTVYSRYVPNLTRRDGSAIDQLLRARGFTDE